MPHDFRGFIPLSLCPVAFGVVKQHLLMEVHVGENCTMGAMEQKEEEEGGRRSGRVREVGGKERDRKRESLRSQYTLQERSPMS